MTTLDFEPSTDQQAALDAILDWRDGNPRADNQYLTLGGYAGTGKSTLVAYLAKTWADVAVVALCGKAAHVLRTKGVPAQTIHSLIYAPIKFGGRIRYQRRRYLGDVGTIIVDEASMVDHLLFRDLLYYGIPILFVGDHGQLEPIGTNPGLMAEPMLRLEQIHRQALDNPILQLATAFREGRPTPHRIDSQGRLRVLAKAAFHQLLSQNVQAICGFNRTRHGVNQHVRKMMGVGHTLVAPGEKLVCLKNNKDWNIFNGQQVTVLDIIDKRRVSIDLDVQTDDGRILTLTCLCAQFGRDPIKEFREQDIALMDYGYFLTAHKAQGSEWDDVLVVEEITGEDPRRWRYTAATRAKERLNYCA